MPEFTETNPVEQAEKCEICKKPIELNSTFCTHCGFPQHGDEKQKKEYRLNLARKKVLLIDQEDAIKKAKNILFILAGISGVLGSVIGFVMNDLVVVFSSVITGGIYLGLGFWSRKNPFTAILTGFLFYITVIAISAIIDPMTLVSGIIWKVIIISAFIYGFKHSMNYKKNKAELDSLSN